MLDVYVIGSHHVRLVRFDAVVVPVASKQGQMFKSNQKTTNQVVTCKFSQPDGARNGAANANNRVRGTGSGMGCKGGYSRIGAANPMTVCDENTPAAEGAGT
jgi:hypothetical protein